MSKFFVILMSGLLVLFAIIIMQIGVIAIIVESSFNGKFGSLIIITAGGVLLIGSIALLKSGLRLEDLYRDTGGKGK